MVNKDQVSGAAKQAKGAVKDAAGKMTGSKSTQPKARPTRQPASPEGRRRRKEKARAEIPSSTRSEEGGSRAAIFSRAQRCMDAPH